MLPSLPIPPTFNASVEPEDGAVRVRFAGELDLGTLRLAEEAVAEARREGAGPLLLDLSELTFVDSSGLRLIVKLDATCRSDGCPLTIVPGGRGVQRVFELAGVLEMLPFRQ